MTTWRFRTVADFPEETVLEGGWIETCRQACLTRAPRVSSSPFAPRARRGLAVRTRRHNTISDVCLNQGESKAYSHCLAHDTQPGARAPARGRRTYVSKGEGPANARTGRTRQGTLRRQGRGSPFSISSVNGKLWVMPRTGRNMSTRPSLTSRLRVTSGTNSHVGALLAPERPPCTVFGGLPGPP